MEYLLKEGADVNSANHAGETAVFQAAAHGHIDIVNLLFDHNANIASPAVDGWTPLTAAIFNRHLDISRRLLSLGADPMAMAVDGQTPISLAASLNNPQFTSLAVEMLREYPKIKLCAKIDPKVDLTIWETVSNKNDNSRPLWMESVLRWVIECRANLEAAGSRDDLMQ